MVKLEQPVKVRINFNFFPRLPRSKRAKEQEKVAMVREVLWALGKWRHDTLSRG